MWNTQSDSARRGGNAANPAVRQGVMPGRRRPAAFAIAAMLCVAAFVAAYLAWRGLSGRDKRDPPGARGDTRPPVAATNATGAFRGNAPTAGDPARGDTRPPVAERQKTPEEIEAEERAKDPLYDRHHIVAKRPLLDSPLEQIIHSVFSVEVGDMPPMLPPLPTVDEKRLRAAIESITEAKDGDSEEAKDAKRIVNQVKAALREFLDDGGTVEGFLQHYVNVLDSAFSERNMCRELQMKSMKTDPPEVAREFYNAIQKRLDGKGIKRLTLTRRQKEYLGIEE